MSNGKSTIIGTIKSPVDVRRLSIVELRRLAAEIRDMIIQTTSRTGGHIAPSLGAVELTLALHYVFNTPEDQVFWDVGHQTYAHKIITGRADRFSTLRQKDGLSGFPKRAESPYDAFDAGHAGDSISAALGLAVADRLQGNRRKAIAVIGDGSIVTGMAFEALNNAGGLKKNLIVVLNDNEMSIARSTGGFAAYLNRIITGRHYNMLRTDVWNMLGRLPTNMSGNARLAVRKVEEGLKNLVAPSVIFEELGFRYFGPFDGHNLISLIDIFRRVQPLDAAIVVHVVTHKGKGYPPAEQHPERFHGAGKFDVPTGKWAPTAPTSFTNTFGETMIRLARQDPKVVAISAGMTLGTGLAAFREEFPDRFFDTGISEQHAVAFAAGLALAGMRPVVAIYSTFLARAYDQIIQDVCLQNLPVVFAIDRAGLVGEDGPTHHGTLDLSYLRAIPNLSVMAPATEDELRAMLSYALQPRTSPIAIRYPKGASQPQPANRGPLTANGGRSAASEGRIAVGGSDSIVEGKGRVLTEGGDIAILALGSMVLPALAAAETLHQQGVKALVADMRFVKPLDAGLLADAARRTKRIFTIEENATQGGFGAAVLEAAANLGIRTRITLLGLEDRFLTHASRNQLLVMARLDPESLARRILEELKK
jgi:1-deoxy-D-xylulose-5-phosphate synthase